jgi:hypothetical protein
MKKAYEWAKVNDEYLLATNMGFSNTILVIHEEGSTFLIKKAFLILVIVDKNNKFIVCFSEHQGFHIWAEDELVDYQQFSDKKIQKIKIT